MTLSGPMYYTLSLTVFKCTTCQQSKPHQRNRFFRGVMTPALLLVRPGLHRQMLDFSKCQCHCRSRCRGSTRNRRHGMAHRRVLVPVFGQQLWPVSEQTTSMTVLVAVKSSQKNENQSEWHETQEGARPNKSSDNALARESASLRTDRPCWRPCWRLATGQG